MNAPKTVSEFSGFPPARQQILAGGHSSQHRRYHRRVLHGLPTGRGVGSPDACSKSVMENRRLAMAEKKFVAQT